MLYVWPWTPKRPSVFRNPRSLEISKLQNRMEFLRRQRGKKFSIECRKILFFVDVSNILYCNLRTEVAVSKNANLTEALSMFLRPLNL